MLPHVNRSMNGAAGRPLTSTHHRPARALGEGRAVDVKFRIFIPSPMVVGLGRAFGGDGRGFSYDGGTSRGELHARVSLRQRGAPSVRVLSRGWSETTEFDTSDAVPSSGPDEWWADKRGGARPIDRGALQLADSTLELTVGGTTADNIEVTMSDATVVHFVAAGNNPLVTLSPDIDASLRLHMKIEDGHLKAKLIGSHDGFPAYEVYVERQRIYGYTPSGKGVSPASLFAPSDVSVETGWTDVGAFSSSRSLTLTERSVDTVGGLPLARNGGGPLPPVETARPVAARSRHIGGLPVPGGNGDGAVRGRGRRPGQSPRSTFPVARAQEDGASGGGRLELGSNIVSIAKSSAGSLSWDMQSMSGSYHPLHDGWITSQQRRYGAGRYDTYGLTDDEVRPTFEIGYVIHSELSAAVNITWQGNGHYIQNVFCSEPQDVNAELLYSLKISSRINRNGNPYRKGDLNDIARVDVVVTAHAEDLLGAWHKTKEVTVRLYANGDYQIRSVSDNSRFRRILNEHLDEIEAAGGTVPVQMGRVGRSLDTSLPIGEEEGWLNGRGEELGEAPSPTLPVETTAQSVEPRAIRPAALSGGMIALGKTTLDVAESVSGSVAWDVQSMPGSYHPHHERFSAEERRRFGRGPYAGYRLDDNQIRPEFEIGYVIHTELSAAINIGWEGNGHHVQNIFVSEPQDVNPELLYSLRVSSRIRFEANAFGKGDLDEIARVDVVVTAHAEDLTGTWHKTREITVRLYANGDYQIRRVSNNSAIQRIFNDYLDRSDRSSSAVPEPMTLSSSSIATEEGWETGTAAVVGEGTEPLIDGVAFEQGYGSPMSAEIPLSPRDDGGMSVPFSDLRTGDIIVSTTDAAVSRAIRRVTGGPVSHAKLYVGDGVSNHSVVEAVGDGVVLRSLEESLEGDTLAVAFRHPGLGPLDALQIRDFAGGQLGKPYDFLNVVRQPDFRQSDETCNLLTESPRARALCRAVTGPIDFGRDADNRFFCSELIARAYESVGIELFGNIRSQSVAPADVALTASLAYVGHIKYAPAAAAQSL